MADVDQRQGGPGSSRRKKHAAAKSKPKPQPSNDWPRAGEPRSRASPRSKRHGDIDIDIVESSDDANDARASSSKQPAPRHRPVRPSSIHSGTASDATAPAKAPQPSPTRRSKSMRVPKASVPVQDTPPVHRRPTCIIEEEDDDDDSDEDDDDDNGEPSGPSRPHSRQTIARREISPRSAHPYRSTPESRRSPRTSVSDSEDETDATSDSDEEQVIQPRGKHLPPAPMAPAVPSAPPAVHPSLQERLSRRPEMVYEDEEGDGISRYAPSARHRSLSRPPSSRQDRYRRPRDIVVSGPPSLDETRRSRSRSKSARPSRRHYESDVYVPSRPASSFKRAHAASSYSLSSSTKRSTFFAELAAPSTRPLRPGKPAERTTVCVRCRDSNTPVSKTAKLKCCHRMCHPCIRKLFNLSLADPQQHMPPRCCTNDAIPTELVALLFDSDFMKEWTEKYMEHTGRGRLVCPSRRCGEVMKPEDMRREAGRWQGRCSRCRTKVCGSCRGRWHHQPECPRDDGAMQFAEQGRCEPQRRCPRCKTAVEIKDGRNHMICRCGVEFCLVCRGKWKTCQCPWFKDDSLEADPMNARGNPFASRPSSPRDRDLRSDFAPPHAANARLRPSSYEEDAHLRRLHEQRDDHLARRMHSFDAFGHHSQADFDVSRRDYDFDDAREPRDRRGRPVPRDYDASFPDDEYHRRAATVVAQSPPQAPIPAAPAPPHSAFEPPSRPGFDRSASGFDYTSAVHRSRGGRYSSPDRYDDYMTENYTPERRRAHSPDPWQPFPQEQRPRSRDRRYTFPTESRPTSPEVWQPPTRYPSLERPVPASEERRRAPSPDRRRISALEKRLADRFKKESWQSPVSPGLPVGAIGPAGPIGAVGPLGPLSPTRVPPPPSRAATHIGTAMPMAPMVPGPPTVAHGTPPAAPGLRRHHTMDEDVYGPGGMLGAAPSPSDWFGPPLPHGPLLPHGHPHAHPLGHPIPPPGMGMMMHHGPPPHPHPHPHPAMQHDMAAAAAAAAAEMNNMNINSGSPRAPHVKRRAPAHREHNKYELPRSSVLAGLGGMGRGMHRVSEWVNYVEPGLPEDMATVVQ